MPQLEFWHFLPQFFWLAVCFTILYLVMAFVALPKIGGVLAARKEKIESDLDAAQQAKSQANAAMEAYEASLVGARQSALSAVGEANQAAAKAAEARNHELDGEIAAQIEEAQRTISAAKADAMENLTDMAADAAREATVKLIGVDVSDDDVAKAVVAAREG
ncbi:MAG: F0F1 ATP synthase subunit B' [Rhodospirillaceae bacterium]|nr:F0F1 ATP synthase subunit B' [Rhodospirillaceae bacterium]|tara:strand:+ start:2615 stop:3100 length:486 start_codon:yes stop_codon:yes gene_type:complete